ncbi:MAG: proprotein convertase P-domain-containing protein, partial [Flavobacteriales bacterium]|nr:proprotein convertase P-domain-containing protein [Flavobacteriales bacterium]
TGNVTLTLSNLNGVAPGLYSFDVIGNNGLEEEKVTVQLRVYSAVFTPIVNQSPNNTAINQSIYSNLTWDADVNAENYEVQISTNSGFTNIVESATVSTNSFISAGLQLDTQYFWRVRPTNRCGQGSYTNPIFFITVNLSCNTVTNNTVATIASVANTVVNSTINFNDASITSLYDIDVDINITHTWVQDMTLTLISPQGTAVALLQENCSSEDNINATFDDNGGNIVCSTTPPAISGRVKPVELLSQFIGENPNGTWTLEVNDPWNGDGGTLNSWSIKVCKQIASNLSTKDIAFQNLSVWPNPANNIVNISFESDANDIVTIEMFDIQGRILKQQKADASIGNVSQSIDLNSLPVGVYVLKMTQGNKQFNSKIVKQ